MAREAVDRIRKVGNLADPVKHAERSEMDLRRGIQLRGQIKLFTLHMNLEKSGQSRLSRMRDSKGINLKRYCSSGEESTLPAFELIS